MTIAELKNKYTEAEISSIPGDDALRFAAFAPLFQNLHNKLLVYREGRFYAIVAVTNLELLPQRLSGQAQVFKKIERSHRDPIYPERPWRFSCNWGNLRLCNRGINAPQISFTVWPESEILLLKLHDRKLWQKCAGHLCVFVLPAANTTSQTRKKSIRKFAIHELSIHHGTNQRYEKYKKD